jgi:antitoxin YefM
MLNYHQVSLAEAHQQLTQLCTQVLTQPDIVIITPTQGPEVVLMAKAELNSLLETAHLLSTPANASRLLTALQRAKTRTLTSHSQNRQ